MDSSLMHLTSLLPFFLVISLTRADVLRLNRKNFESAAAGKNVFIKFFAPGCAHCKAMAPAWEQLASDYEKSPTTLIAQVDCIVEEDLCSEFDVEGFPTLLYGDVSDMNVYEGDHDYESLKEFAEENLTTEICSIHYEGACSKAEKDAIAELRKKTLQELLDIMKQFETEAEEAESLYQAEVERLEELYRNAVNALSEKFETLKKEKHYAHVLALLAKMKADKEEL